MESKSPPRPFLTGCSCGAHSSWQHGSPLPLHTLVHAEALLALSAWDSLSSVLVHQAPSWSFYHCLQKKMQVSLKKHRAQLKVTGCLK